MLSQLLLVPAGGALTDVNPWTPMWLSSAFIVLGFLIAVLLVPETLPSLMYSQNHDHQGLNSPTSASLGITKTSLHHHLRNFVAESRNLVGWISNNFRVILVLCCFFAYNLGTSTNGHLLLQYAANRLRWPLSKVVNSESALIFNTFYLLSQLLGIVSPFIRCWSTFIGSCFCTSSYIQYIAPHEATRTG